MVRKTLFTVALLVSLVLLMRPSSTDAQSPLDVNVDFIIEESDIFPNPVSAVGLAIGDLTNDGNPDLAITKGAERNRAGAAVFQNLNGSWDNGSLLSGPSVSNAARPIVAPIRNDGQNWLVYSEHRIGNTGEWLRSHRYSGTTLVENRTIAVRERWPGQMAPAAGDLDGDGNLAVWFFQLYGRFPNPDGHLFRAEWNPATNSFDRSEIINAGHFRGPILRPHTGDFLGNGSESLVWKARSQRLDLVTFDPSSSGGSYTSTPIFTPDESITEFDVGEFDGFPGEDIAVSTWNGSTSSIFLISGNTFAMQEIASNIDALFWALSMGDLDGNGRDEIYAAARSGGIYGYDIDSGWRQIANYPDITWQDRTAGRFSDADRDEIFFAGPDGDGTFSVVSLNADVLEVSIDIKPGSDPNSINCTNERGVIPVAILTTAEFDALTVDHTTVTFEGVGETHVDRRTGDPRRHEDDVNGDGDMDLVFHFRLGPTGLTCTSIEAALTGETFDGLPIKGSDEVRMIDRGRGRH